MLYLHKMKRYGIIVLLLAGCINSYAQQKLSDADVHITKFSGGRVAAICYAFDDGLKNQYDIAVPMLNKYRLHGTFFVIPFEVAENDEQLLHKKPGAWGGISWLKLQGMARQGHEIASHSWSHKNMRDLKDDGVLQREITKADSAILKRIGTFPLTFAYPYNAFDARVHNAVLKDHIAAREFQLGIGSKFTTAEGNHWIDDLIAKQSWSITMIHAISHGFDTLANPKILDDHLRYASDHQDKIWVDTFVAISKYIKERDSVVVLFKQKENEVKLFLKSPLNRKIYNQPLTVALNIGNVVWASASQKGKTIPVKINPANIYINAIPGPDAVSVKWKTK